MPSEWNSTKIGGKGSPSPGVESSTLIAAQKFEYEKGKNGIQLEVSRYLPTPSNHQRTTQACDKCRERKTKCSGDHPVCHRCTARGLNCQYSSRETRLRGPSKVRLRSIVSSTELHSSSNRHNIIDRQHLRRNKPEHSLVKIQQYHSPEYPQNRPTIDSHRRIASSCRDSGHRSSPDSMADSTVCGVFNALSFHQQPPEPQKPAPQFFDNQYIQPQWKGVRHVQSQPIMVSDKEHDFSHLVQSDNDFGLATQAYLPSRLGSTVLSLAQTPLESPFECQQEQLSEMYPRGRHSDMEGFGDSYFNCSPNSGSAPNIGPHVSSELDITLSPKAFEFTQIHAHSLDPDHLDGSTHPVQPQANYQTIPSVSPQPDKFNDVDLDQDIPELVYPSPITPIGIDAVQDIVKNGSTHNEFYDYLPRGMVGAETYSPNGSLN